ncbi:hypothetical protein JCM6882_000047 [Rhodosporidiobolus microsporus]
MPSADASPAMLDFVMIDTMTEQAFTGNPSPVFIFDDLPAWPSERALQALAAELNQSETTFLRRQPSDPNSWLVRWFTPLAEEFLCGHGLLAAASALHSRYCGSTFSLVTIKGVPLAATLNSSGPPTTFTLSLPSVPPSPEFAPPEEYKLKYASALGIDPSSILELSCNALMDVNILLDPSVDFSAPKMKIDPVALMGASPPETRSQIVTSAGTSPEYDFLKRVFAYGGEDQATGSTYCALGPYWRARLGGKSVLRVHQPSARKGWATLTVKAEEVLCDVTAVTVGKGELRNPDWGVKG